MKMEEMLEEVEKDFNMSGLSDGLYGHYAATVAKKAVISVVKELVSSYQQGSLCVSDMNDEVEKIIDMSNCDT